MDSCVVSHGKELFTNKILENPAILLWRADAETFSGVFFLLSKKYEPWTYLFWSKDSSTFKAIIIGQGDMIVENSLTVFR